MAREWFEFILDFDLLDRHLSSENLEPSLYLLF